MLIASFAQVNKKQYFPTKLKSLLETIKRESLGSRKYERKEFSSIKKFSDFD